MKTWLLGWSIGTIPALAAYVLIGLAVSWELAHKLVYLFAVVAAVGSAIATLELEKRT